MRALALAALLVLPLLAEDPTPIADLIAGLRDESASRRDACEAALGDRWDEAKADLENARGAEKDLEAKVRIERILARGPEVIWVETVAAAFERAAAAGRPVLVVRGDGPRATPDTIEGRNVRAALDSVEGREAMRGYVAVWLAEEGIPGVPNVEVKSVHLVEGYGGVEMYVASPKLGLCHYLRGYWFPERTAMELRKAKDFASSADRTALDAKRVAAFEALKEAFEDSGCANARRHLHPWHCGAEGCVLRRLGICHVQGNDLIGSDLRKALPAPLAGGEEAKLPF